MERGPNLTFYFLSVNFNNKSKYIPESIIAVIVV